MSKSGQGKPEPTAEEQQPAEKGIECPRCGCRHFYVVYTRTFPNKIVRRRECRHCGRRISTVERRFS